MANIDDLVAQLAQEAKAVTPAPHPFSLSLQWIGAAAIYLALSLALSGLRADLVERLHSPWFVAEIAALLTLDGEAFERFALSIDPRLQKASLSEPQHCGAPRRRASERIA